MSCKTQGFLEIAIPFHSATQTIPFIPNCWYIFTFAVYHYTCGADTTDVQWAIAEELVNGSVLLKCGFAEGSRASGCQLTIKLSHTGKVRIVVQLYRSSQSQVEVWEMYRGPVEWGLQPLLLVSDIEEDGTTTTATRELEGSICLLTTVSSPLGWEFVCIAVYRSFINICIPFIAPTPSIDTSLKSITPTTKLTKTNTDSKKQYTHTAQSNSLL